MKNPDKSPERLSAKFVFATVILVAALVAGSIYLTRAYTGNEETQTRLPAAGSFAEALLPLVQGDMAALFIAEELTDRNSLSFQNGAAETLSIADRRGKIVLLNLWATWCPPCRAEMPALDSLQAQLGGADFEVVAVNVDRGGPGKGKDFYAEIGLTNLGYYYDGSQPGIVRDIGVLGMPTTLLLDREGNEIARLAGPAEWASDDAVKMIEAAIGVGGG